MEKAQYRLNTKDLDKTHELVGTFETRRALKRLNTAAPWGNANTTTANQSAWETGRFCLAERNKNEYF